MAKKPGKDTKIVWNRKEKTLSKGGEPLLKYSMQIPILENNQKGARRINSFYERTAQAWEKRWTGAYRTAAEAELMSCRAGGSPYLPWEAALTAEAFCLDENRLSIRMEAAERRENGRISRVCWGDVWDLRYGAPCSARELVPWKKKKLLSELIRQGRMWEQSGLHMLDPDWEKKIERLLGKLSPCLTEQGLEYMIPQAYLAPAAEGILRFSVSSTAGD